jgi:hypothetical protein
VLEQALHVVGQQSVKVVRDPACAGVHPHGSSASAFAARRGYDDRELGGACWEIRRKGQLDTVALRDQDGELGGMHDRSGDYPALDGGATKATEGIGRDVLLATVTARDAEIASTGSGSRSMAWRYGRASG